MSKYKITTDNSDETEDDLANKSEIIAYMRMEANDIHNTNENKNISRLLKNWNRIAINKDKQAQSLMQGT